ncbi:hypothetical protein B0H21DRAFT_726950 [Amylocystis lapponica]|nr:hypothetical protein B0H21DRAFT_726950 [Amylocystis lapponica]
MLLPPELYDRTIDFLWDDPRALMACSLTCSAWVPSSRFHLFHSVKLRFTGTNDCERLEALLNTSDEARTGVVHYIRDLNASGWDTQQISPSTSGLMPFMAVTPLARILTRLTDVQYLTIKNAFVTLRFPSMEVIDELFRSVCAAPFYTMLTTLRLESVAFHNANELRQLVSAFPKLTVLDVRYPYWPSKAEAASLASGGAGRASIKLAELVVHDSESCGIEMAGWLSEHPFEPCLRTLDWRGDITTTRKPVLRRLLEGNAASLENVRLQLAFKENGAIERELADLSACTRLVTAQVGCSPSRIHCISVFLSHMHSFQLQQLTITLGLDYYPGYHGPTVMRSRQWNWGRIDEDLTRLHRNLPRLNVVFCCHSHAIPESWTTDMVDTMADSLPISRAAGLRLVMRFCEDYRRGPYTEVLL